jgi:hypothetical protein
MNKNNKPKSEKIRDLPYPHFAEKSFLFLKQTSKIRNLCLRIITLPWLERLSISFISLNLIILAMYKPCDDNNCLSAQKCFIINLINNIIFVFFFCEMLIKIVAMGAFGKRAYFSNYWNILDFFIVLIR